LGEIRLLSEEETKLSRIIFGLLKQATSQQIVKDFLKEKGVATSAQNWDDLFTRRIQPALNEGVVTVKQLRELLQEVEECGRKHVFLYECSPELAQQIISQTRIEALANEVGVANLLATPLDLELPEKPTLVDIRITPAVNGSGSASLLLKVVETREFQALLSETTDEASGRLTKVYSVSRKRAVNIAFLRENGLLELRVTSQDNKTRYHDNVRALQGQMAKFIPRDGFSPISLKVAKSKLHRERKELAGEVRYSNSSARNAFGYVLNLGSSSQTDNLSTDDGSMAAIETFLDKEGEVTGTNIYFKIPRATLWRGERVCSSRLMFNRRLRLCSRKNSCP
jgi:hypothetical protein